MKPRPRWDWMIQTSRGEPRRWHWLWIDQVAVVSTKGYYDAICMMYAIYSFISYSFPLHCEFSAKTCCAQRGKREPMLHPSSDAMVSSQPALWQSIPMAVPKHREALKQVSQKIMPPEQIN